MMRKHFMSLILLVFVIFGYNVRSIGAGQSHSTGASREGKKRGVTLETDGSAETETVDEGIFLSQSVIPDDFPMDFLEPAEDDAIMNAARTEMREIGIPGFAEEAKNQLRDKLKAAEYATKREEQLTTPWQNEAWLIRFLRAKRYDVKETYKLIQRYYKFKSDYYKAYFKTLIPSEYVKFFKMNILLPLPGRDKKGRRILLFRANKWKPSEASLDQMFSVALLLAEAASYEPKTQIAGVQLIIDWEGFNQTSQFVWGLKTTWAISQWLQSASPYKLKGLHIINPTDSFVTIQRIFDKVCTSVMKERVHVHPKNTDLDVLYEQYDFDRSNLPEAYKGTLDLEEAEKIDWANILKYCDQELEEILSYV